MHHKENKPQESLRGLNVLAQQKMPKGVQRSGRSAHKPNDKGGFSTKMLMLGVVGGMLLAVLALVWWSLPRRPVFVEIDSIPQGVDVFVDGARVGVTPLKYRSPRRQKTIHVELRANLKEPYKRDIYLPLFGSVAAIRVAMPLRRAHLRLRMQPKAVQVYVDNEARCVSPCELDDISPRQPHVLRFAHEGCADYVDVVNAEPDERLLFKRELKPEGVQNLVLLRILATQKPIVFDGEDLTEAFSVGAIFVRAGRHVLQIGSGDNAQQDILVLSAGTSQRLVFGGAEQQVPQPRRKAEGDKLDIDETGGALQIADADGGAEGIGPQKLVAPTVDNLCNFGLYLLARGQASAAKDYFVQALSLDHKEPRAHRGIIASAIALRDLSLARGQLGALLDLHSQVPEREMLRFVYFNAAKSQLCHSEKDSPR